MESTALVQELEERTRLSPDRVVRLHGFVLDEPFELLIFRGFSSSTTHPTAFDPDASVLPDGTRLDWAELLQGPAGPLRGNQACRACESGRPAGSGQLVISDDSEHCNSARTGLDAGCAGPHHSRSANSVRI